jgi:hypothetical protein
VRLKAEIIAVNEPRTVKAIIPGGPGGLGSGNKFSLVIVTQSSVKHSGTMLKSTREIRSEFMLTTQ